MKFDEKCEQGKGKDEILFCKSKKKEKFGCRFFGVKKVEKRFRRG